MSAPGKFPGPSAFAMLGLVGQLGLSVAIPIVLGVVVGHYLDGWLGAHGLILSAMILLGVAGGVFGAYLLLAKEIRWKK